jgi:hypothetical protein
LSSTTFKRPSASRSRRVQAVRAAALKVVVRFGGETSCVGCFLRFSGVCGGGLSASRKWLWSCLFRSAASQQAVSRGSAVRTILAPARSLSEMAAVTACRLGLPQAPIPKQPQPQAR